MLEQATVRNVSRALHEINGFEWEGDFKPMARQALKELLEKRLEEEMAEGLAFYETMHALRQTTLNLFAAGLFLSLNSSSLGQEKPRPIF
jgi:hypothetical protein